MDSNRKQIRLNEKDQAAYQRGLEFLKVRNPFIEPNESDILRTALNMAFGADGMLCPYCDTPLVEHTVDDGGTLGIWYCPECASGNGKVVIAT